MPDLKPTPTRRLLRTLNRIRARGPLELVALAWERKRDWWSSEDALEMMVRPAEPIELEPHGLTFRMASEADAAAFARDIGTESAATFATRLSDNVHCFVVEGDGRLMHASWVTTTGAWTREIRAYLCPPTGDIYIYESFTRADARGRGIYPIALRGILRWANESGFGSSWVAAEADNEPSLRAIAKAGFTRAFELRYRRRWGRLTMEAATGEGAAAAPGFVQPDMTW